MDLNQFTPTQQRILELLEDGMPHHRKELIACLNDELADRILLNQRLCALRKKLRPEGHEIICELGKKTIWYRHVLLIGKYVAVIPPAGNRNGLPDKVASDCLTQ